MSFPGLEPIPSHLVYLILSAFLILYALFSELIRNRLHLSEPPLATLVGILFGGVIYDVLDKSPWRYSDSVTQEITRVIVGIQVFTVGLELPAGYVRTHWRSIVLLLGPNMIFGWFVSASLIMWLLNQSFTTSLLISACLTPTDPVLSASVLGEARFSSRVPQRLKRILSAESGCNDGTAYPFLYAAIFAITKPTTASAVKWWFIEVILWQCGLGVLVGATIGFVANRALQFSERRKYVQENTFLVFYFLLALFSIGVGSTLGLDDFLVAFSAGAAFSWDDWFSKRTHRMQLPSIIDLLLNSSMFVYFGTIIPWSKFSGDISWPRLLACTVLILVFRRLPAVLVLKRWIPDINTWTEAFFAGHFGPMGVGALFLAIEARARLETGSSIPLPHPPRAGGEFDQAIDAVWPVVCFIVLGSIFVHGLSALAMSLFSHFVRDPKERAPLLGAENDRLYGMRGDESDVESPEESET